MNLKWNFLIILKLIHEIESLDSNQIFYCTSHLDKHLVDIVDDRYRRIYESFGFVQIVYELNVLAFTIPVTGDKGSLIIKKSPPISIDFKLKHDEQRTLVGYAGKFLY